MIGRDRRWRISEVAKRYHLHPQTLRLYEREGLLRPSRSRGNARGYCATDLERLECILNLTRDLGVNLAGVEVILNMRDQMHGLRGEIARLSDALEEQLRSAQGAQPEGALVRLAPRPMVKASGRGGR